MYRLGGGSLHSKILNLEEIFMVKKFFFLSILLVVLLIIGGCSDSADTSSGSSSKKSDKVIASAESFNPEVFIKLYNANVKKMNASDAILLSTTPSYQQRSYNVYQLEGYRNSDIGFSSNNNIIAITYSVKKKSRKDLCDSMIAVFETLVPGHGSEAARKTGFVGNDGMLRFPIEAVSYGNGSFTFKEGLYGCFTKVEYNVNEAFDKEPGMFTISLIKPGTSLQDL